MTRMLPRFPSRQKLVQADRQFPYSRPGRVINGVRDRGRDPDHGQLADPCDAERRGDEIRSLDHDRFDFEHVGVHWHEVVRAGGEVVGRTPSPATVSSKCRRVGEA